MKNLKLIIVTIFAMMQITNAQIITTIAGDSLNGYNGDNILADTAQLNLPIGVAVDASGNIYIADYANNRIRKVTVSTGIITTIAGNGNYGFSGDNGLAVNAQIYGPYGIALDNSGNVYIADVNNNRIRKVNSSSGIITTIAGDSIHGYNSDGILATAAELYKPAGVVVDDTGNVYIADTYNNRVRKINHTTGIISTIAGTGNQGYNGDSILATDANVTPWGLAIDAEGNIFIADDGSNRIRKINHNTGIIYTIAGNDTAGYNGDGILAIDAELRNALQMVTDSSGNLYIADVFNQRIRKVNSNTGIINTIAGDSIQGYNGDNILATSAELNDPYGIAIDLSGNIYIADWGNNRVRKITYQTVGIQNFDGIKNKISIYPNPASSTLTIHQSTPSSNQQLLITDVLGREVYHQPINNSTQSTIDISTLSNGVYLYQLKNDKETMQGKFVVEK
jgi:sugar lactone lactonase YvrE